MRGNMKKTKVIVVLSILASAPVFALDLTEAKVIEMALERNERIGISQAELEIAEKTISKAYSSAFPTFSAQATLAKSSATGSVQPNGDDWSEGAVLQLNQPIYTFGKVSSGIDIAKSAREIQANSKLATEAEVKQTAKKLFYAVLYNEELVKINSGSFENAKLNKRTLEKRVAFGRISRNDNLKMQADLASRRPQLIESQNSLAASKIQLADFLAIDSKENIKAVSDLQTIPRWNKETLNDTKVDKLANVRIMKEQVKLTESSVEFARAGRFPTLSAFASYSPTTYRSDFMDDAIKEQETAKFGIMLSFDWDLGGSKNHEVAVKKIENKIAELQLKSGLRNTKSNFRILTRRYESLVSKLEAENEAVKLAEASYKVALSAFSTGAISQLQLNDSELLLTNNKRSLAGTGLSLLNTIADLDRLLFEGSERGEK